MGRNTLETRAEPQAADGDEPTSYVTGFGNEHSSEALPGALPVGQNNPKRPAYGLYTEQLNGTSFLVPRATMRRSWLYRIRPSVVHPHFTRMDNGMIRSGPFTDSGAEPNKVAWSAVSEPAPGTDFISGLVTQGGFGSPESSSGMAVHWYCANTSMPDRVMSNTDGEFVIIPTKRTVMVRTEFGRLSVPPGHIALIPRAVKFSVDLLSSSSGGAGAASGIVVENYGAPFVLPELGVLGANGLANARDFEAPVAAYEDSARPVEVVQKTGGNLWTATYDHSPFDVVAWHGTHVPYRYDLSRFQMVHSTSFDHTDPSIATLLVSPTGLPGVNNIDLFTASRGWFAQRNTFRPNWYHRNVATEYIVRISAPEGTPEEDLKAGSWSEVGYTEVVNQLTPHGVPPSAWEYATDAGEDPIPLDFGLLLGFEAPHPLVLTSAAATSDRRLPDDQPMFDGLISHFTGPASGSAQSVERS
ncbi:homogentisate 1,2-dioxygenase [Actinacidiphila guanduensis]|uniref:Homogentisate 1,2-dioxygenase n=1 Tax=Actinacidiphila guanduensis TaxID=310781 RepID=A0A1H0PWW5_9ACTN|nr:homogentisate 1,2-dioxygenase [Actinacidiphila guanduensis]SDP09026.1 homogentisate 1,2-dioxygenase [Actinacidiphila guanduensis]